jgi:NADH:ubiquinone reductase (H+-translocating)
MLTATDSRDNPVVGGGSGTMRPRIVIVGSGFAGAAAARALERSDADVILIDRRNHHIFQPLLYQVATAVLAPSEIAAPIRQLEVKQANLDVVLADVVDIDTTHRTVDALRPGIGIRKVRFDFLVVAAGTRPSYFGHDEYAAFAPGLKTLTDAEMIRTKILTAFETAEATEDANERARQMNFVLVGAGPTGVELAASIAQMVRITLRGNFRQIDPATSRITLIEGGDRILPSFAPSLSTHAAARLAKLGVKVMTGVKVDRVDQEGVIAAGERIPSATVLWTAGMAASPIVRQLGAETDRAGRALVGPFLDLPAAPNIFVIGDAASLQQDGRPIPGVAQAAIQQGHYVGRLISDRIRGRDPKHPFRYRDRGNMAVVGKNFAILEAGHLRMSGLLSWFIWAFIHLMALPQLQNRWRVQSQWLWSYLTGQRSSRLISEAPRAASAAATTEQARVS